MNSPPTKRQCMLKRAACGSTFRRCPFNMLAFGGLSCVITLAVAIAPHPSKTKEEYEITWSESNYPAVFQIPFAGCAGTVVEWCMPGATSSSTTKCFKDRIGITAAHCWSDVWPSKSSEFLVKAHDGKSIKATNTHRMSCWSDANDGPNGCDVAVFFFPDDGGFFGSTGSGQSGYQIYPNSDELGKVLEFVGWGAYNANEDEDGKFRYAENRVDKADSNTGVLQYTLDAVGTMVAKEGIAFSGDSGGPGFLKIDEKTYIAGVNSGGDCCSIGHTDQFSRLSSKRRWLDETIGKLLKDGGLLTDQELVDAGVGNTESGLYGGTDDSTNMALPTSFAEQLQVSLTTCLLILQASWFFRVQ